MEEPMTPEQEERNREERIRLRALEIWRKEGYPEGRAQEHWAQAEREVGGDDPSTDDQPSNKAAPDPTAASPETGTQ
jgi:hypothetical protein